MSIIVPVTIGKGLLQCLHRINIILIFEKERKNMRLWKELLCRLFIPWGNKIDELVCPVWSSSSMCAQLKERKGRNKFTFLRKGTIGSQKLKKKKKEKQREGSRSAPCSTLAHSRYSSSTFCPSRWSTPLNHSTLYTSREPFTSNPNFLYQLELL